MEEPRTHYQVSFTSRQALSVFLGLLVALGLAYFLGLMTGLAGRGSADLAGSGPPPEGAGATPAPEPAERRAAGADASGNLSFPLPVTAVPPAAGPAPPVVLRTFEDREAAPTAVMPTRPAGDGFRVQVLSVSSRKEADAEAARLARLGLPAHVETTKGPKGSVYRVRLGPYPTREEATRASRRLAGEGRRDTWIVPPGQ